MRSTEIREYGQQSDAAQSGIETILQYLRALIAKPLASRRRTVNIFPRDNRIAAPAMIAVRQPPKIGLLAHMGGGNLGDDATQVAVMNNIKQRWPKAAICGFTLNPDDTMTRHGIPSYPIRTRTWALGATIAQREPTARLKERVKDAMRKYGPVLRLLQGISALSIRIPRAVFQEVAFLHKSLRLLRTFDVFVISGSGQLLDWDGPWLFPYTIFKWVCLARAANVKRIFLNVGAGPLNRPLSRFFIRHALRSADYVSFRDENSHKLVRQIGFQGKAHIFPDSVYSLDLRELNIATKPQSHAPTVGIAPMPYFDPRSIYPVRDQHLYDRFIEALGLFGSSLLTTGYSINLFCNDIGIDPPSVHDLETALRLYTGRSQKARLTASNVSSVEEVLSVMSSMDYVVTCRFHGIVFAHLFNKPVLAISHHPKMTTLMNDLDLSRYCVDIREFDAAVLADTFADLVSHRDDIKARMAAKLQVYRGQLSRQFDELFPRSMAPALEHPRLDN